METDRVGTVLATAGRGKDLIEFTVTEQDLKEIARALELMYVTNGNKDTVLCIMGLEFNKNQSPLVGALNIAYEYYTGESPIYYNKD